MCFADGVERRRLKAMAGFPRPVEADLEPDYEKIGPTRILPHLYIGCMQDALNDATRKVSTNASVSIRYPVIFDINGIELCIQG